MIGSGTAAGGRTGAGRPRRQVVRRRDLLGAGTAPADPQARRHLCGLRPLWRHPAPDRSDDGLYHRGHALPFAACACASTASDRCCSSSTVRDDNDVLVVDLTNPDFINDDRLKLARETIHISRARNSCGAGLLRAHRRAQLRQRRPPRSGSTLLFDARLRRHLRGPRPQASTRRGQSRHIGRRQPGAVSLPRARPGRAAHHHQLRPAAGEPVGALARRSTSALGKASASRSSPTVSCAEQSGARPVAQFLAGYKAARAALRRSTSPRRDRAIDEPESSTRC